MSKRSDDSGIGLTEDKLDDIEDIDEFYDIMDEYGLDINLSGLDDLDASKERMREYIFKVEVGNFKLLISRSMESKSREDKHKRDRLQKVLEEFKATVSKYSQNSSNHETSEENYNILDKLQNEGTVTDFFDEIDERIKMASDNGCPLVIAGETNAGKSTLINLLLGENILPTSGGSCTSVITRISYGKTMKAEIRYCDGTSTEFDNINQERLENEIWPKIYVKENIMSENDSYTTREILSNIQEIRFELPSRILKCGLVLIDSPGIGENEAMDSVVANYVKEQCVMGYIYIIKSDNAGGVDEDRLLSLIRFVLECHESKRKGMCLPFNSKSAIFVCNRWDAIKSDERDAVFQNAYTTLRGYWPNLDMEQITTISATAVILESEIDPDYVPEMYRMFLEHLRDLFINAVDNRVDWIYEWLNRVNRRTQHHLDSIQTKVSHTLGCQQDDVRLKKKRLNLLRNDAQPFLEKSLKDIEKLTGELCLQLRKHLQANYIRQRLMHWDEYDLSLSEIPADEEGLNTQHDRIKVEKYIDGMIEKRLTDVIVEWEEDNEYISRAQEKIIDFVRTELYLPDEEIRGIENVVSNSDIRLVVAEQLIRNIHDHTAKKQDCPSSRRKSGPLKAIKHILTSKKDVTSDNVVSVAEKRTLRILQRLLEDDNTTLLETISRIMQGLYVQLENLLNEIPSFVQVSEQALQHSKTHKEHLAKQLSLTKSMNSNISLQTLALRDFSQGFSRLKTFISEDIELKEEEWLSKSSTRKSKSFRSSDLLLNSNSARKKVKLTSYGLWTALQPVNLALHTGIGMRSDATIRIYLPLSQVTINYREVSRIRQLRHPCIASFEGIHYSDSPPSAMIFTETLYTLSKRRDRLKAQFDTEISQTVIDIASGLSYLHSFWLVHMELTIETITLNPAGIVKLSGGCLPRCATLPDSNYILADNFVCLAPDVLKGQRYSKVSDIYSLGLLLFELSTGVKPYRRQRNFKLSDFIKNVNPLSMIQEDIAYSMLTKDVQNFVGICVNASKEHRDSMEKLAETLKTLRIMPVAESLENNANS